MNCKMAVDAKVDDKVATFGRANNAFGPVTFDVCVIVQWYFRCWIKGREGKPLTGNGGVVRKIFSQAESSVLKNWH